MRTEPSLNRSDLKESVEFKSAFSKEGLQSEIAELTKENELLNVWV